MDLNLKEISAQLELLEIKARGLSNAVYLMRLSGPDSVSMEQLDQIAGEFQQEAHSLKLMMRQQHCRIMHHDTCGPECVCTERQRVVDGRRA